MGVRIDRRMALQEGDAGRALLGAERHSQVGEWRGVTYGRGRVL